MVSLNIVDDLRSRININFDTGQRRKSCIEDGDVVDLNKGTYAGIIFVDISLAFNFAAIGYISYPNQQKFLLFDSCLQLLDF